MAYDPGHAQSMLEALGDDIRLRQIVSMALDYVKSLPAK